MKKILCILLLSALALTLAACSSGGGSTLNEDGLVPYSESGLEFALPEEMTLSTVDYADICYSDGTAEFLVYFYPRDTLLTDLFLDKDATVEEYAEWFVHRNGYVGVEKKLDESGKRIELSYVYDPDGENTHYVDIIMRNTDILIHVTFSCPNEKSAEYEGAFDTWKKYVSLTYPDR